MSEKAETEKNEKLELNNVRNQYIATFTANLVIIGYGMLVGWYSPAVEKLASNDTILTTGPLTTDDKSWLGSINCIAALPGSICFGFLVTVIGAKRTILFLSVPCLICWVLIYFGDSYAYIFSARSIGGWVGAGTHSTLVLFVSEIANDDIRGRLASMTLLSRNIGILCGYIFGATIQYHYIPIISASIFIIFIILFTLQPNSPRYYIRKKQFERAENALKHFKGYKGMCDLENFSIQKELERLKLVESEQKVRVKLHMSDFLNQCAIKGILIGITLVAISHSTTHYMITSYAVTIFQTLDSPKLDPNVASIVLAVALILGSLTTTTLADILGRKILILISLLGSACGLFATAIYDYLRLSGYDLSSFIWVPVLSMSTIVFISSAGIIPLSVLVSIENFPQKTRNMSVAIIIFASNLTCFLFLVSFPKTLEVIHLYGYMTICGILCILGTIFIAIVLKETNGMCLDDVGSKKKRKRIHSVQEIENTRV